MDQAFKVLTLPDRDAQTPASGPHYISLEEMLQIFTGFLHRQYPVIGVASLLIMALAAVYLFTTPPSFTAVAKLMIDSSRKVQPFQQQMIGDISPESWSVDSQVEVLQSENVALAVIKELPLTEDPDFVAPYDGLFFHDQGIGVEPLGVEPLWIVGRAAFRICTHPSCDRAVAIAPEDQSRGPDLCHEHRVPIT